jgi:toxin ParE1/3/4
MTRVLIEPAAKEDLRAAFGYYQAQRPGLGHEFRDELKVAVRRIRERPASFPEVEAGVRWTLTDRFPYKIFFLADEDPIRIIAVLHGARHWDAWRERHKS